MKHSICGYYKGRGLWKEILKEEDLIRKSIRLIAEKKSRLIQELTGENGN